MKKTCRIRYIFYNIKLFIKQLFSLFFLYRIAEEKKNAGNDQYKAQNYRQALRYYSDAITLCPDIASYYNNRSACYMMLCDFQLALQDVQQAIRIDPSFEKAYIRAIKCYLTLGDVVRTEQTIKKLFEIDSKVTTLKTEISNCKQLRMHEEKSYECYDKRDYRTAIYHIDMALKISTASMKLKLLKAECLALMGRTEVNIFSTCNNYKFY